MDPLKLLNLLPQWWQELQKSETLFNQIIISLIIIFFSLYVVKLIRGPKLNLPPSPRRLPVIGNLHQLGKVLHQSLRGMSEKYGPLMLLHFGNVPTLIVNCAEISKEIMTNSVFQNRPQIKVADALYYGCTSIAFCPYGEYWRETKKICVLQLLSLKRVQDFQYVREVEVAEMIKKVRGSCCSEDGALIDLSEMFVNFTSNVISTCALGRKYTREDGSESFGELARRALELIGAFNFHDIVPYLWWIDVLTGFNARVRKTVKEFDTLLDQVIEDHQQKIGDQSDRKDLVDILLSLEKDDQLEINLTRENLKAILLDMFIGGIDNSASIMEWAMAELTENPTVMRKAQEEVRRVVGIKSKIDEGDIAQMEYLKCVIKETLRLHGPVLITRESTIATKLEGYDIPAKTRVLINAWAIQRDPRMWERSEEFVPERFVNNPVDFKGHHNQFLPFGMGRRACPGIIFAMAEIEYVLANLLYWFDWKLPGQTEQNLNMSDIFGLVNHKKVNLRLVPVMHSCSS
ncbi:Cytochrome P450, E-class, group I [Trema orientale]|uniref:Cytochrome P450, E-class, group I n=1 Tax=Trema orientale TaxID=63057 RepID=A0A2P5FG36_TREOI|nr:Cytochrome P450, E-class, group I [Trema orientale]